MNWTLARETVSKWNDCKVTGIDNVLAELIKGDIYRNSAYSAYFGENLGRGKHPKPMKPMNNHTVTKKVTKKQSTNKTDVGKNKSGNWS